MSTRKTNVETVPDALQKIPLVAIFGYGSLLFRPGFAYLDRRPAHAPGYARRFSQASPDHRGTPERPGRVVTLSEQRGASCAGAVYWVRAPAEQLLQDLDHRERAGYARISLEVLSEGQKVQAVTWVAPPGNAYDAGELELRALAELIRDASGPSGRNDDYVFALERALFELGAPDPELSQLSALLRG